MKISDTVWERTEYEDSHVPSVEALHYHWLRCCWVSNYWSQANVQNVTSLDLLGHGWAIENQTLKIVWDSQENIERVRENVKFLTSKGCSCKGNCSTRRSKCSKQHKNCRANCKCSDCENPHKDGKCKWNCPDIHVTNNENIVEISQTVKLNDLNDADNESDIETSDVDIDTQYESEYEGNENDNFDGCDDFEVSDKTYTEDEIRQTFGESDDELDYDA